MAKLQQLACRVAAWSEQGTKPSVRCAALLFTSLALSKMNFWLYCTSFYFLYTDSLWRLRSRRRSTATDARLTGDLPPWLGLFRDRLVDEEGEALDQVVGQRAESS